MITGRSLPLLLALMALVVAVGAMTATADRRAGVQLAPLALQTPTPTLTPTTTPTPTATPHPDHIFSDDFDTGGTSKWSYVKGGALTMMRKQPDAPGLRRNRAFNSVR
jgi:hypothetical protein